MAGRYFWHQAIHDAVGERTQCAVVQERRVEQLARVDWGGREGKGRITAILTITLWLNWSSTFYLLAVLEKPIAQDMTWPLTTVVMGLSMALVLAGLVAPIVGRAVERYGGRTILAFGSLALAFGLTALGLERSLWGYFAAWTVVGIGMAASLYEAVFGALGQFYGLQARSVISALMLTVALALTLSWPLSALLLEAFGWRGVCLCYAGMHLFIGLPMHRLLLPRLGEVPMAAAESGSRGHAGSRRHADNRPPRRFVWLVGANLTLQVLIGAVIAVHLLSLLQGLGIAYDAAVALGSVIWLAQGGGRLAEVWLGQRFHPVWEGMVASTLVVAGLALMLTAQWVTVALGLVLFGVGSGVRVIVRGTLPLMLFGAEGYAVLTGRLGLPTLIALAAGPALGTIALTYWGPLMTVVVLTALAAGNVGLSYSLRLALPRPALSA
jgi:MFS family permease